MSRTPCLLFLLPLGRPGPAPPLWVECHWEAVPVEANESASALPSWLNEY